MKRGAQCREEEVIDPNSFRAPTGNSRGGGSVVVRSNGGCGNQAKTIRRKPTAEIQSDADVVVVAAAAAAVFYTVANVKNLAGTRAGKTIGRRDKCRAPIGPGSRGTYFAHLERGVGGGFHEKRWRDRCNVTKKKRLVLT